MAIRTLIFDLDETLVPEYQLVRAAFAATCTVAEAKHGWVPGELAGAAQRHARDLWKQSPHHGWCAHIGVSSWEGLSGDFGGTGAELSALREWLETSQFRARAWHAALKQLGVDDQEYAQELADRFVAMRTRDHEMYPDAKGVLEAVRPRFRVALLTNGAPRIQREKISRVGLDGTFDPVIVSGEIGHGKPDPRAFEAVLSAARASASECLMIGDSLGRDVAGAHQLGIPAVWLNRHDKPHKEGIHPDHEITNLDGLLPILGMV